MAEEEFQEQSSVKTETEKEQSAVEKKKAKEQSATEKEKVNVENVMEQVEYPVIIESEDVKMETEPDYTQMEVKNPRIGKVLMRGRVWCRCGLTAVACITGANSSAFCVNCTRKFK